LAAQPARPRIQNKNRMEQNFLITDPDTTPRPIYRRLGDGTYSIGGASLHASPPWRGSAVAPTYISAYRNPSVLPT
jgi:hypothetical protein